VRSLPTAAFAGLGLIAGYAVAVASGSRPLGGVVLLLVGAGCARVWLRRDGPRTAALLTAVAFTAFVGSHVLALAIGAWPAVLVAAAVVAVSCWRWSDARTAPRRTPAGARP
jgi:hypothetical protein